jgi:hypothetical protein
MRGWFRYSPIRPIQPMRTSMTALRQGHGITELRRLSAGRVVSRHRIRTRITQFLAAKASSERLVTTRVIQHRFDSNDLAAERASTRHRF